MGSTLMPRSKSSFHRNGDEWRADRLLLNKEVMMSSAVKRFLPLLDDVARDFCRMLRVRVEREGRGEEGKRTLTMDPSPDLFRFALEGRRSSYPVISDLWCILMCGCTVKELMKSCFIHAKAPKSYLFFYPGKES